MNKIKSLSISIPVYNEETCLLAVLEQSALVAADVAEHWEIFVIDDGSRDRTPEILRSFAAKEPRLKILTHPQNLGFGATLRETYTLPAGEWIFPISGDGQVPPKEIYKLIPYTATHDIIYAWRKERADPWRRRFTAWVFNGLVSLYLGVRIHDVDSSALFRKRCIEGMSFEARSVFILTEFLCKALRRGFRHIEVPIDHRPRLGGHPAGGNPWVILRTVWDLFRFFLKRRSL